MKILWHSNAPWTPSGYGVQTRQVTERLRAAGHDVAISCFYGLEGGIVDWNGFRCYPTDHTRFGRARLHELVEHFAAGDPLDSVQVITLNDVWTLIDPKTRGENLARLQLASWTPVDHDPVPPRVLEAIRATCTRPIAMSKHGAQALANQGCEPLYAPHAVETAVYMPLDDYGRCAARDQLGIRRDAFVVGMVANNQGNMPPRKAFPQVFQAFAAFRQRHPEAILYLHTDMLGHNMGVNLVHLAAANGIPMSALATTNQQRLHVPGISDAEMLTIYNAFDVLACPSYGEGFGVPIIEAQACGVPVIVTDWTAMTELCGAGWLVEGDSWYDAAHGSFYLCPSVLSILEAMEAAHASAREPELRDRARSFALGYDADVVFDGCWLPIIDQLAQPKRVGPITAPNRAARRAAARSAA